MPILYMNVPEPTTLTNRGEAIDGDAMFDTAVLLEKVEDNPKWATSRKLGHALDAIMTAWAARRDGWWCLADSDHAELVEALENPAIQLADMRVVPGLGYHPRLTRQILPYIDAIADGTDKTPEGW